MITNLYDRKRSYPVYIRVSILNFIELLLNRRIIKFNQLVHSMIGRNVRTSNGLNKFGTGDLKRDQIPLRIEDRVGVVTHMETQLVAYKQFRMVDVRHLPRSPLAYIRDTGAHPWLPTPPYDPKGVKLTLSQLASSGVTLVLVQLRLHAVATCFGNPGSSRSRNYTSTLSNRFKMTENWSVGLMYRLRRCCTFVHCVETWFSIPPRLTVLRRIPWNI